MKVFSFFMLGRPGSGKDTQAAFLADYFDLVLIKTSGLLKEKFENAAPDDEKIKKEKELFESGLLSTSSWVVSVIKEKIGYLAKDNFFDKKGIVFSGSPRTLYEAENLLAFILDYFDRSHVKAIVLNIDRDVASERILKRAARPLDLDREKINTRMEEYEKLTEPAIEYLKAENLVIEVDSNPPAEEVSRQIIEKLSDLIQSNEGK